MQKTRRALTVVLDWLISICLVCAAGLAFVEVILRYIFGTSLSWSFEVLLILLTYMSFLGAALALEKQGHLKVMVLANMFPQKLRLAAYFFNLTAVGLTAAVMTIWGTLFTIRFSQNVTDILLIPVWWIYVVIPISGAIMSAQIVADIAVGIMKVYRGEDPDLGETQVADF